MILVFRRIVCTLLPVLFLVNFACKKTDVINDVNITATSTLAPTRGGIALTFDDYNIDNWYKYVDLFDSLQVKATFYISNYNLLTNAQKNKLKDVQKRGHEIAFHSSNHVNFLNYASKEGTDKLIKKEINEGLALMNNDGFYPTTFAYPFGKHNDVLDKLLLKQFKSVRALNGTHDLSRSLAPLQNNKLLFSLGIDESSKRSMDNIKVLLVLAQQKDRCAVMLAHNIEKENTQLQIPVSKLKELIIAAKNLNLRFYTVAEISRY